MRRQQLAVACVTAAVGLAAARAQVVLLRSPGGGDAPLAVRGLSADGGTAVLHAGGGSFAWTPADGLRRIAESGLPGRFSAVGVSGDGRSFLGAVWDGVNGHGWQGCRWRGPGDFSLMGTLPGILATAPTGLSGDGSVACGSAESQFAAIRAFRWTESDGIRALDRLAGESSSGARAISRDGSTIVGWSSDVRLEHAVIWNGTGVHELPLAPGLVSGQANGVNADGRVVVGEGRGTGGFELPVVWRDGECVAMSRLANAGHAWALATSDDGAVMVGDSAMNLPGGGNLATVWMADGSARSLSDHLAGFGISTPEGWTFESCNSVSADGRTFGGVAINGASVRAGFVVTVPGPGALVVLGLAGLGGRRRR